MKSYALPVFNETCDVWLSPNVPTSSSPTYTDFPVQVYVNTRMTVDIFAGGGRTLYVPPVQLRMPSDFGALIGVDDVIGVGASRDDYYRVRWVQEVHLGFINQYTMVVAEQCDAAGTRPRPA